MGIDAVFRPERTGSNARPKQQTAAFHSGPLMLLQFPLELGDELSERGTASIAEVPQLQKIHSSLASFDVTDIGLWPAQGSAQADLCQPGRKTKLAQLPQQYRVVLLMDRLGRHVCKL